MNLFVVLMIWAPCFKVNVIEEVGSHYNNYGPKRIESLASEQYCLFIYTIQQEGDIFDTDVHT